MSTRSRPSGEQSGEARIRTIQAIDADAFLRLCRQLDREIAFMLLEPAERSLTVEEHGQRITDLLASGNSTILVAEAGGRLVGYLAAGGGRFRRERNTALLVVS